MRLYVYMIMTYAATPVMAHALRGVCNRVQSGGRCCPRRKGRPAPPRAAAFSALSREDPAVRSGRLRETRAARARGPASGLRAPHLGDPPGCDENRACAEAGDRGPSEGSPAGGLALPPPPPPLPERATLLNARRNGSVSFCGCVGLTPKRKKNEM